jgi:hypothetical protein
VQWAADLTRKPGRRSRQKRRRGIRLPLGSDLTSEWREETKLHS